MNNFCFLNQGLAVVEKYNGNDKFSQGTRLGSCELNPNDELQDGDVIIFREIYSKASLQS